MQIVLVILIVALIAKDISYVGDPYLMRGTAQALCLFVGGLWLARHLSGSLLPRYWPVIGYLLILCLATYGTRDPIYVTLQVASLTAMVIFGIAYFEAQTGPRARGAAGTLIKTTVLVYGVVAWLSLATVIYAPSVAYQDINAGNIAGTQVRFRGLFSQTGMMGTAAGLLVVLSLFGFRRLLPKLIFVFPGMVCLAMTASRTYWVAAAFAIGLTALSYWRTSRIWVLSAIAAGVLVMVAAAAFDIRFDAQAAGRVVRVDSVSNLSGRIQLWERAAKAFELHPYLGSGFTAGSAGLEEEEGHKGKRGEAQMLLSREMGRTTMHSGYVQSLLDSGLIGTIFYVLVILLSIHSLYRHDKQKHFPAEFAGLIFLAIANFSESTIYSASVFSSILFWILATFALSLRRRGVVIGRA